MTPDREAADLAFLRALVRARAGAMVYEVGKATGQTDQQVRSRASRLKERDLIVASRYAGWAFYRLSNKGRLALRRGKVPTR